MESKITKEEIRKVLAGNRFEMSGYDKYSTGRQRNMGDRGSCVVHNTELLNRFAKYGIYEHTNFLYLDFYKGGPELWFSYWGERKVILVDDMSGFTTVDMIARIFDLTVYSNKNKRRVNE
jgi:hypothetical protein